MATEGTKFQVNYKMADGTLINLYASNAAELESGLADLAMNAALIKSTGTELGASSAPASQVLLRNGRVTSAHPHREHQTSALLSSYAKVT